MELGGYSAERGRAMGVIQKLRARLGKNARQGQVPAGPPIGSGSLPTPEELVQKLGDPVHASYAAMEHITSLFAENISAFPELKAFARLVLKAQDVYMPSAPPMSPITTSFFATWAFYDLQFSGTETIGTCLLEMNDVAGMSPGQLDALKKLSASRMGIYEHIGLDGRYVRLRELITNAEYSCHCTAGYCGQAGELWYIRLLPPLVPDLATYHIVFTTPYILTEARKADWVQFLNRGASQSRFKNLPDRMHQFLKFGPDPFYWSEFVFKGYHHHQHDAIFLAGIPDRAATLPHA